MTGMMGRTTRRMICLALVLLGLLGILSGCASQKTPMTAGTTFALDTFIQQKWFGRQSEDCYREVNEYLRHIENLISRQIVSSEITAVNEAAGSHAVAVSDETFELLAASKALADQSDAFSLTIGPLVDCWGIGGDKEHVPSNEEIAKALSLVDDSALVLDGAAKTAYLQKAGMSLDLGGLAKGWICTKIRDIAAKHSITDGYVSLGGNLMVLGRNVTEDKEFLFGVRDPLGDPDTYLGTVTLAGKTMATSGNYERYFEADGIRYHHIFDPSTGMPANRGLISVTVISEDGILADYLSTRLFVEGKEEALRHLEEDAYALILVDEEHHLYVSPSLEKDFTYHETEAKYALSFGKGSSDGNKA